MFSGKVFSNGQFDFLEKQWFVFDPNREGRPGSFVKVKQAANGSVALYYYDIPERRSPKKKHFRLFLNYTDTDFIGLGEAEGDIFKKGCNKEYYDKVNLMRMRASEFLSLKERLKPGEYLTDYGKCYICGEMERTEGEVHPFFVREKGEKQFVSKKCWTARMGNYIEEHPISDPVKLRRGNQT